jgi:hypothetical protein
MVMYLPMGSIVGHIKYESSVEEIYDVQILEDVRRPGILNTQNPLHKMSIVTPEVTYWAAPEKNTV